MTVSLKERITRRANDAAFVARYRLNQLKHASKKPGISSLGRRIVREMNDDGVSIVPLESLNFASNPSLLATLERVDHELDAAIPDRGKLEYRGNGFEHCVPINPTRIATDYPDLFLWGLDEGLLDIVENCLGLPPAYHGVVVRKEIVDGRTVGTRLWHADSEDLNIIRVMIYLSDVLDDDSGPFEYVPRNLSPTYRDFRGVEDRITDEEMAKVVPATQWKRALGMRGTVLFGAVARIFHHGKMPFKGRKMASFYYTSRHPRNERLTRQFSFEAGIPSLQVTLNERQRECLWKYQDALPKTSPFLRRAANRVRCLLPLTTAVEPLLSLLNDVSL